MQVTNDGSYLDIESYGSEPYAPSAPTPTAEAVAVVPDTYMLGSSTPVDEPIILIALPANEPATDASAPGFVGSVVGPDYAESLAAQLTAPGFVSDDPMAAQAASALTQLVAAHTDDTAEQLAPALQYWVGVAETALGEGASDPGVTTEASVPDAPAFNPDAEFVPDYSSPEMLESGAAFLAMAQSAAEQIAGMIDGSIEIDADDVTALQGALADGAYAAAFGAKFEGNTEAAQAAAALSLSYVDSMAASGTDVSSYDRLVADMQTLRDTGELPLSYIDAAEGRVETGKLVFPSIDGGTIEFDQGELATLLEIFGDGAPASPPDVPTPAPTPSDDPSTDPGFDGTGLDLSPASDGSTGPSESFDGGDFNDDDFGDFGDFGDFDDFGGDDGYWGR